MRRHLLLQRRLLLPRLVGKQPLVRYISRQHVLPTTLGLSALLSEAGEPEAHAPLVASWWPALSPPREQSEERAASMPEISEDEGQSQPPRTVPFDRPVRSAQFLPAVRVDRSLHPLESFRFTPATTPASQPRLAEEEAGEESSDLSLRGADEEGLLPAGLASRTAFARDAEAPAAEPTAEEATAGEASAPPPAPSQRTPASRPAHARVVELGIQPVAASEGASPSSALPPSQERLPAPTVTAASGADPHARIASDTPASEGQSVAASSEDLFRTGALDRSPRAWLERLMRQARREQEQERERDRPLPSAAPPSPASSPMLLESQARRRDPVADSQAPLSSRSTAAVQRAQAPRVPETLSTGTALFLKPLVGIDPTAVPLYRDSQAAEATAAARADALSDATGVELAPQHAQSTPETLGLLAHELTHVARRQQPDFQPPIVRARPLAAADVEPSAQASAEPPRDEEALALQVERRVRQTARASRSAAEPIPVAATTAAPGAPAGASAPPRERGIWRNLPAPWEPLPAWLTSPPTSTSASVSAPPSEPAHTLPTLSMPASSSPSPASEQPESQKSRAGVERDLAAAEEAPTPGEAPQTTRTPEPDLDALARQVYTLLKRRLSVEQRRTL